MGMLELSTESGMHNIISLSPEFGLQEKRLTHRDWPWHRQTGTPSKHTCVIFNHMMVMWAQSMQYSRTAYDVSWWNTDSVV